MTTFTYSPADVVSYVTFLGATRTVTVTEKDANIKNGRPGFIGRDSADGELVWGYDSQIIAVAARPVDSGDVYGAPYVPPVMTDEYAGDWADVGTL